MKDWLSFIVQSPCNFPKKKTPCKKSIYPFLLCHFHTHIPCNSRVWSTWQIQKMGWALLEDRCSSSGCHCISDVGRGWSGIMLCVLHLFPDLDMQGLVLHHPWYLVMQCGSLGFVYFNTGLRFLYRLQRCSKPVLPFAFVLIWRLQLISIILMIPAAMVDNLMV